MFAYRRPGHLRRAAESLTANREAGTADLYIFCDGAKGSRDAALAGDHESFLVY
jgi:hypothetical protein